MKNGFLSLGTKIVLIFFLSLASAMAVGVFFFMQDYASSAQENIDEGLFKAQNTLRLYRENLFLRSLISETEDPQKPLSDEAFRKKQRELLKEIPSDEDVHMSFIGEQLKNTQRIREQTNKVRSVGMILAFVLTGVIFFLSLMWLVIRRLILLPAEEMITFSRRFSSGDLNARIAVSEKKSDRDEMDLLARDLNKMAQTIGESFENERQRQRFLQNLLDSLPEGVRVIDENRNVVLINRTCREMFRELSLPDAVKCYECVGSKTECSDGKNPCPFKQLERNPDKPVRLIHSYTEPSGRDFYIEVSAKVLDSSADGKKQMLEVSRSLDRDIRFSHTQKLSSLGLLAGSVAHELRNPLGAARLILENMIDKEATLSPSETDKYLKLILDQMGFCISITERLLKLSRKSDQKTERIDLNRIVSDTAGLLEYEAKKNGIDIKKDFSVDEAFVIASDSDMRMVFLNLMQNAFHAMPDGGILSLSSAVDGDNILIRIADTGCGIAPENLNRIFEPFFSEGRPSGEGTGLGLPIVKNIIESLHGKISVESERGKGTVFEIRISKADQ